MIVTALQSGSLVRISFECEAGDRLIRGRARVDQRECEVWLPVELGAASIHPDLIALAAFLVVQPWIGRSMTFKGPRPSDAMCKALGLAFGIRVFGGDSGLSARPPQSGGRPGLSFSAGMDSTAALVLMPQDTVSIFLNRVAPGRAPINSNYRSEFALHAITELRKLGREVLVVDSSLEYTRRPVGFPVDWSNAVPAVLLADELNLRSVAWGMVLESAYAIGSVGFRNWPERDVAKKWGSVFAAAGLPMSHVVSGLSEVCTSSVVMSSNYANLAQSCIRGTVDEACGACPKCFRKGLLESALGGRKFDEGRLSGYLALPEVRDIISSYPIKHENVLGYCMEKYAGSNAFFLALRKRLRVDEVDYSLFERYYSPYLENLPEFERRDLENSLGDCLVAMSSDEEMRIASWCIPDLNEGTPLYRDHQRLLSTIG